MQIDLIKKKPPTLTPYQVPYLPNPHCTYPSHHEQVKLSTTKEPNVEATNLKRRIQVFLIPPIRFKNKHASDSTRYGDFGRGKSHINK